MSDQPATVSSDIQIRLATIDDVDVLASLSEQLGYPSTSAQMRTRLRELLARRVDHAVFVATIAERVAGWVHVTRRQLLEVDDRAEILGLVVASDARQRGIGRALIAAAEVWAGRSGLLEVVVRSNVARAESHPFYERIGYARTKTQHVYLKRIQSQIKNHKSPFPDVQP